VGWDWDFGDGTGHSQLEAPVHPYTAEGSYIVTLVVTDNDGASSAPLSQTVTVSAPPVSSSRRLGFSTAPATQTSSGARLQPAPEVQLLDGGGNDLKLDRVNVSASIGTGEGSLSGRTTRPTNRDGRARFGDLSIIAPVGSQITLVFQAQGFASLTSTPISVE
jgi:PKD repeat protein